MTDHNARIAAVEARQPGFAQQIDDMIDGFLTGQHEPNRWRYVTHESGVVVASCPCGVRAEGDSMEAAERGLSAHVRAAGVASRAERGGVS